MNENTCHARWNELAWYAEKKNDRYCQVARQKFDMYNFITFRNIRERQERNGGDTFRPLDLGGSTVSDDAPTGRNVSQPFLSRLCLMF